MMKKNTPELIDPWSLQSRLGLPGGCRMIDATSRLLKIRKSTDTEWLKLVVAWRGNQKSVQKAAERRLRRLTGRTATAGTAVPKEPSHIWLGDSGFVFLDERPRPYAVKHYDSSGEWWLHYWSDSVKGFITMRRLAFDEVERFRAIALPAERASLYFEKEGA